MNVCIWGGFPTEYSFDVHRDQADYWLNIHLVYKWVRRIADRIFIQCMQDSAGLLTGYSFGVCRGQADYWPDIHLAYGIGQVDCWLNIHSVYAGMRRITDRIFSQCINGSGGLLTKYSFGDAGIRRITDWTFIWCMQGSGRLPIGYSLIGLGWIFNCRTDWVRWIRIQYLIIQMIGLGGLEMNIQ
jgi:hypothetical protein